MSLLHKIKIKNGDYSTGKLDLSDGGHTKADKTDYVNWSIKKNANNRVACIIDIQRKTNNPDIFSTDPHANGEEWSAEIDHNAPYHTECYYSICWKGIDGNDYIHDPKLSVKPSTAFYIMKFIHFLLAIFLGFFTWKFLRREKSKR